MKRKFAISLVVAAAILLISGASILAASPGTAQDPVVTLSYLTNIFRPAVMNDVRNAEQEMIRQFETRLAELESRIQESGAGQTAAGTADRFHVVTLSRNQTLSASVGTEIMLRIGTASASGSEPALVNYTTGETLSAGSGLTANHMYLITIEGNGIVATADTVRILVRGVYTIS